MDTIVLVKVNRLSTTERAAIVRALVEGNSIRATCRITGAAKDTVRRLLADVGAACDALKRHVARRVFRALRECFATPVEAVAA